VSNLSTPAEPLSLHIQVEFYYVSFAVICRSAGSDGMWIQEDASLEVKNGDTINYWILIMVNGGGYQVIMEYVNIEIVQNVFLKK
jgi:hypothetical protein